jgi:hypothetical protein
VVLVVEPEDVLQDGVLQCVVRTAGCESSNDHLLCEGRMKWWLLNPDVIMVRSTNSIITISLLNSERRLPATREKTAKTREILRF